MKKIPLRTCVVTKEKLPKRELIRVVRTPDGEVVIDETGKLNGRGTYLKLDKDVKFIDAIRSGKVKVEQVPWTEEQIKEYENAKAEQEKAVKAEQRRMKKEQKKQYSE